MVTDGESSSSGPSVYLTAARAGARRQGLTPAGSTCAIPFLRPPALRAARRRSTWM